MALFALPSGVALGGGADFLWPSARGDDTTETVHVSCAAFGLAAITLGLAIVEGATYHVSPTGNDADPGSRAKPFATLTRARDAVRQLKASGSQAEALSVTVHGGTYRLETSLVLGPEDSGTASAPVVWEAAPGEEVRLSGGIAVVSNRFQPLTETALLERLDPAARGQIVRADLRGLGLSELAGFPDKFRGVPAAPELFFNDQRMTLARWPNEGWVTIARIIDPGSVPREGEKDDRPGIFEYDGERPARWNVQRGVWLQGYWSEKAVTASR